MHCGDETDDTIGGHSMNYRSYAGFTNNLNSQCTAVNSIMCVEDQCPSHISHSADFTPTDTYLLEEQKGDISMQFSTMSISTPNLPNQQENFPTTPHTGVTFPPSSYQTPDKKTNKEFPATPRKQPYCGMRCD